MKGQDRDKNLWSQFGTRFVLELLRCLTDFLAQRLGFSVVQLFAAMTKTHRCEWICRCRFAIRLCVRARAHCSGDNVEVNLHFE